MCIAYAPLSELSDCTRLTDIDTPVDKGEFIVFYDGEKVKVARGVNSFVTTVDGKGDSFKKIKIVEAMDMINDDITKTAQDSYLGKYANSYSNKCLLLSAISSYFAQLQRDGIVSSYSVGLDADAIREYLKGKHELHLKYVIRYADDCIILHDSKEELWQVLEKVETFLLENLKLNLNNKTVIRPTTCNIDFVGYMINKDEIRLRSATVKRMRSRIKYIVKAYERGEMTLQEVNATMQSYFGLIKHCTNEGLRENIINGFVLHCTDAARAKARESR